MSPKRTAPANPATAHIHELLDQAADEFHAMRGDFAADRGEQFDAHLATVRMVVDHSADTVEKENV